MKTEGREPDTLKVRCVWLADIALECVVVILMIGTWGIAWVEVLEWSMLVPAKRARPG